MRTWLVPITKAYQRDECRYPKWLIKSILQADDKVIVLDLQYSNSKLFSLFQKKPFKDLKQLDWSLKAQNIQLSELENLIKKYKIDSFFSHATFWPPMLRFRKMMLSPSLFEKVLSIWHEGGFLRHICFQLDWYGWNGYSSLANMDISNLPILNLKQKIFVDEFMQQVFLPQKINSNKMQFSSKQDIKDEFKISQKSICLICLQVHGDSVLTQFAPKGYSNSKWAFDFVVRHPNCFFIIKDHPKQKTKLKFEKKCNWLYLLPSSKYDTQSLAMNVDAIIVVNSTVGMESIYWTPVFRAGHTIYSHDSISQSLDKFNVNNIKKKDVYSFLYYAIKFFHYTPGINADSHSEWFNFIDKHRKTIQSLNAPKFNFSEENKKTMENRLFIDKSHKLILKDLRKQRIKITEIPGKQKGWFHSTQKPEEILQFLEIVGQCRIVLEIGLDKAGTHVLFKTIAKKVISIDWNWTTISITQKLMKQLKIDKNSYFILGNSTSLKTKKALKKILNQSKIDLLFIDGTHSYDSVKADYESFKKLLNQKAIVAFHDYEWNSNVHKAVDEIAKMEKKELNIIKSFKPYGIAYFRFDD